MKKPLLAFATILTALGAAAQENPQYEQSLMSINLAGYEILLESDGTRISHYEKKCNLDLRKSYKGHIGTWELGFNGLHGTPGSYSMYPAEQEGFMDLDMARSFHFTANLFTFSAPFSRRNTVGITMGLGLAFSDYVFETESAFVKEGRMIYPAAVDHYLKKSKLTTLAFHVPLALEISPARGFFFSVGGYADLLVGSHMKWKKPKEKLHNPYTNFLQAGLTARIGFHKLYVFGNYALTEIFKTGQGPRLNPYTVGFGFGL